MASPAIRDALRILTERRAELVTARNFAATIVDRAGRFTRDEPYHMESGKAEVYLHTEFSERMATCHRIAKECLAEIDAELQEVREADKRVGGKGHD